MPTVKSSISSTLPLPGKTNDVIVTTPNVANSSTPIIPIYANATEKARAILKDQPFVAVNDVTGQMTVGDSLPQIPTIAITSNFDFAAWVKANPVMATGAGLVLAYLIYSLTKKRGK